MSAVVATLCVFLLIPAIAPRTITITPRTITITPFIRGYDESDEYIDSLGAASLETSHPGLETNDVVESNEDEMNTLQMALSLDDWVVMRYHPGESAPAQWYKLVDDEDEDEDDRWPDETDR